MSGQVSSPAVNGTVTAEWKRFGGFLRSPRLPERAAGVSLASLRAVGRMFLLDLALMIALIGTAIAVLSLGFEMPVHKLAELKLGLPVVLLIVIGAPLFEETVFRGWLSGRAGAIWPLLVMIAGLLLWPRMFAPAAPGAGFPIPVIIAVGLTALVAIAVAVWLRNRAPFGFFARHFVWFYALSTVLFALAHASNYGSIGPAVLLLVIPQAIAGLLFGYTRVHYGLWASMLLHALHNAAFISLALLGKSAG